MKNMKNVMLNKKMIVLTFVSIMQKSKLPSGAAKTDGTPRKLFSLILTTSHLQCKSNAKGRQLGARLLYIYIYIHTLRMGSRRGLFFYDI